MSVLDFLLTNKNEKVIQSVQSYFNEERNNIPYSSEQIRKTINWLNHQNKPDKELILEKLNMAIRIVQHN